MTTHEPPFTPLEEEEIKLAILEDDPDVRMGVIERLWNTINEKLMRSLAHFHPGLSEEDHADIAYDSIVEYCCLFPQDSMWADKPIYPMVARVALFAAKDKYKKLVKQRQREPELTDEVAEALADTDLGTAWHAAQPATRERISQLIRSCAAAMPKAQRRIATAYAQTWHKDASNKERIDFIHKQTGVLLSHDAYKRGWDEVRKKLKEPITRLLKEQGYARE